MPTTSSNQSSALRSPARDVPPSEMTIDSSAAAAEYLARANGTTGKNLIERDLAAIQAEGLRPTGCLHVADLDDLAQGTALSESMLEHLRECADCSALLDLATPRPELEERFMIAVRDAESVLRMIGNASAKI
jgi:hypothetical protein